MSGRSAPTGGESDVECESAVGEGTVAEPIADVDGSKTGANADATDAAPEADGAHLAELPDGSGCTEIWEYLSERREADD